MLPRTPGLRTKPLRLTPAARSARRPLRGRAGELAPDLVLTDFSMPGMTGLELRKIGRGIVPEVPFVVMSGQFLSEHVRAEFDAALGKPFSADDVLSTVKQIVDRNYVAA